MPDVEPRRPIIGFRGSPELIARIEKAAEIEGLNRSAIILRAVNRDLRRILRTEDAA